ncbi:MAG TPA: NAD(P)/FAD-dependent oxidoreductase [Mycobacteriales bacterium]
MPSDRPVIDALVVGGGPAGLSAARAVAAAGHRVVVLERGAAFGEPVRTSGGSFVRPLRRMGVPSHLWQPVTRLRVVGPGTDRTFRYRRARMCVLDVRGLYQWLATQAAAAGAELHLREHVTAAVLDGDAVVGVTRRGGGELRARLVVDATGTTGVIARGAGLRGTAPRTAVGVEAEVFAPSYDQREALLVVGDAVAPGGYGWAFPRGSGRVRLGVGVVRPTSDADVEELLANLVERTPALRESCSGAQPLERHSGVMPAFDHGAVPAVADGLVVVGDAAGHGSTLLGEGIRHAMVSGRLAGEAAASALHRTGSPAAQELASYPQRWERAVGRQMRIGYVLHEKVCSYGDPEWSRALAAVARMSPGVVMSALAGDLTPRFAARLALRHPLLVIGEGRRFARAALGR